MLEEMPPFMTVAQAVKVLQIGRTKGYELTTEWEKTGGMIFRGRERTGVYHRCNRQKKGRRIPPVSPVQHRLRSFLGGKHRNRRRMRRLPRLGGQSMMA